MQKLLEKLSSMLDISVSDDARRGKILNIMLLTFGTCISFALVITPIIYSYEGFTSQEEFLGLLVVCLGILAGTFFIFIINRRYSGDLASILFVLLLIILSIIIDEPYQVTHGRAILIFVLPILVASALLRPWTGFAVAIISSGIIGILSYVIGEPVPNIPAMVTLLVVGLVTWLSSRSLNLLLIRVIQNEQNLLQSNSKLQDKLKELEIYTSLLRHDLRNDLQVIIGNIDSALMLSHESEAYLLLESVLSASERMNNLIKVFRKIQDHNDEPILRLLKRVAKQAESANRSLKITIYTNNGFENVKTRGGRLLPMVFENIFRNAAEYAGDTPEVDVFLSRQVGLVVIDIIDDGPGIPPDIRGRIFEKGVSTTGSGLGLYLAKNIIEASNGTITLLHSRDSQGAAFRITLPILYD
jgi:signal transduction histidine kinase